MQIDSETAAPEQEPQEDNEALFAAFASQIKTGEPVTEPETTPEEEPAAEATQDVEKEQAQQDQQEQPGDTSEAAETVDYKQLYEKSLQDAETWRHKYNSDKGRFDAAQRKLQAARAASDAQPKPIEQVTTPAELEAARAEYPEVVGPIVQFFQDQLASRDQQLQQVQQRFEEQDAASAQQALDAQTVRMNELMPDYTELVTRPEFGDWYARQPTYIRAAIERNGDQIVDAEEAADVLSRFKATLEPPVEAPTPNPVSTKRQRQLDAGRNVAGRGVGPTDGPNGDDQDALFKQFAKQLRR